MLTYLLSNRYCWCVRCSIYSSMCLINNISLNNCSHYGFFM